MTSITLAKLVRTSIARRVHKKMFSSLLLQFLERNSTSDNELVEALLDLDSDVTKPQDVDSNILHLQFALEFATSSAENLARFFKLLSGLSSASQRSYITYLRNHHDQVFTDALTKDAFSCLVAYTDAVSESLVNATEPSPEAKNLWFNLVFLWGNLIQKNTSIRAIPAVKDLCVSVMKTLDYIGEAKTLSYFRSRVTPLVNLSTKQVEKSLSQPVVKQEVQTQKSSLNTSNFNNGRYPSYIRLKKCAWLRNCFLQWRFSTDFLTKYLEVFDHPKTLTAPVVEDVLHTLFGGLLLAVVMKEKACIVFNWKNYIVSQLPNDFVKLARSPSAITPDTVDAIVSAVKSYNMPTITQMSIGTRTKYDLGKEFLKSCVYKKIISLDNYTAAYPEDAESLSSSLITHETEQLNHVDGLASEFRSKLASVNTEFTSLEESKLIEFFQQLPNSNIRFSHVKQKKLTELTTALVKQLISEKNNEKLSRLFLALSNSLPVANYIFFNDPRGPWTILSLVIGYMDGEQFSLDDDDSSFQDTCSYFGIILSGLICLSSFFGVDFSSVDIKGSYTANYINRFFYRSCEDLTSKIGSENNDDVTIASNYDKLFTDWANALFDVNNDGLSDDLIRSVSVKQIYKFMFLLFREAIQARVTGALSESSLNNGIDYLSQSFLVPCSLEIIQWLTINIGPSNCHSSVMIQVLLRIIEANIQDGGASEPNYTFRMILNAVGPKLLQRLKSFPNKSATESFVKLVGILKRELDAEYCVVQSIPSQAGEPRVGLELGLRERILFMSKNDIVADAEAKAPLWIKLQCDWNTFTHRDITECILSEVDRCQKATTQSQSEDSRMCLDFLLFFLFMSSDGSREDYEWCYKVLTQAKKPKSSPSPPAAKISLSMDDHFSAIFNESGSAQTNDEPQKSEPREFEVDDLFNDMGEDLFSDSVGQNLESATPIPAFEKQKRAVCIERIHKELLFRISPLAKVVLHLSSEPGYDDVVDATRNKLIQELKKPVWK